MNLWGEGKTLAVRISVAKQSGAINLVPKQELGNQSFRCLGRLETINYGRQCPLYINAFRADEKNGP